MEGQPDARAMACVARLCGAIDSVVDGAYRHLPELSHRSPLPVRAFSGELHACPLARRPPGADHRRGRRHADVAGYNHRRHDCADRSQGRCARPRNGRMACVEGRRHCGPEHLCRLCHGSVIPGPADLTQGALSGRRRDLAGGVRGTRHHEREPDAGRIAVYVSGVLRHRARIVARQASPALGAGSDRRRSDRFCDQRGGDLAFALAPAGAAVPQRCAGYDGQGHPPGNLVCLSGAGQATPMAGRRIRTLAAVQDLPSC